jgi:hypothetical protein
MPAPAHGKSWRPTIFFIPVPVGKKTLPMEKAQILRDDHAFILPPDQQQRYFIME